MFKKRLIDIEDTLASLNITQGRTFYVCQAGTQGYQDLVRKVGKYLDGVEKVYTTIQSAISAAVSNRGDQILVMPDSNDYDSAATITVNKDRLKIRAPFGMDDGGFGATNSTRLHATGDVPVFTINNGTTEITGFFMKCATDQPAFTLATGLFHVSIHHNYIGGATEDGDGLGLIYTAGYTNHASIHHNYFDGGYAPGTTKTIAGAIILSSSSCTRNIISDNIIVTGTGTTLTKAIHAGGVGTIVRDNQLFEYPNGTFSEGISVDGNVLCIENRVAMETGNIANALVGCAADLMIRNYGTDAAGGETILT